MPWSAVHAYASSSATSRTVRLIAYRGLPGLIGLARRRCVLIHLGDRVHSLADERATRRGGRLRHLEMAAQRCAVQLEQGVAAVDGVDDVHATAVLAQRRVDGAVAGREQEGLAAAPGQIGLRRD